ncbi:Thyrotropin-releasing hormone-degrading ectoenzyme [Ooceraea biroi]|uniref:Thyrotropin-releasing hormone-degrading ectoenzyme n=1 Tax=Ooceraea biroi TaxID=2015173 RepID=A0A026WZT9_OOCBI|nr:Thyrotropin-releasing hormone-degrading ectoenzyme [Ooceraea biroi]
MSPSVVPVHYDITLYIYIEDFYEPYKFSGGTNITINILHATQNISIHRNNIIFIELYIILENGTHFEPSRYRYPNAEVLTLYFNFTLLPGTYILHAFYDGYFSLQGGEGLVRLPLTKFNENKTNWMIVSQLGKRGFRRVSPCFDEPALKTTFNISVKHYSPHTVFSTMPLQKVVVNNRIEMQSYFEKTPKMSTHLLGLAIVVTDRCNNDNSFRIWCREPTNHFLQSFSLQYHSIVTYLTQFTNTSRKLPKLDFIIVPDHTTPNNSISWGMLLVKESWITDVEKNEIQKVKLTGFLAHEMAKQWLLPFGPSKWSDMWLNDGLALYFKAHILGQLYGKLQSLDFITPNVHKCFRLDDIRSEKNILYYTESSSEIDLMEFWFVADKTLVLLHMLKNLVTVRGFQEGVRIYIHKHQFGLTTPDDFWDAMQSALNTTKLAYNFEVKEVMRNWLNQTKYSVVKVRRNYLLDQVIVSQVSRNDTKKADNKMWTPVTFTTSSLPDYSDTMPTHWLRNDYIHWLRNDTAVVVPVAPSDWIMVNLQQGGYYRVNYDATNLEKNRD